MTDLLRANELEDESLGDQFDDLMEAMKDITTFDPNREEGAYEALNQRIYQAVTEKPILARIVTDRGKSLLSSAMSYLNLETSHHAIKLLIESNPSALLGTPGSYVMGKPIYMISRHPEHCVLLPWIAANYTWIIDQRQHVVLGLLEIYAQRHRTRCTSTTMKDFFQAYPQAFTQQGPYGDNALHKILCLHYEYRIECDADLFKWMTERCPSSILLETNSEGRTPLHLACRLLSKYKGSDSNEICKYLIQKCPGSIQMTSRFSRRGRARALTARNDFLPIHLFQDDCDYRVVREVVVCLLRGYPESYDIPQPYCHVYRPPSSIPFIQSIKPHLDEEKELKETAASLINCTSSLNEAVTCSKDDLMRSAFTVFDSWSTSFVNTMEGKVKLISTQLQDLCNEGRESDE